MARPFDLLLWTAPGGTQAQFTYATNNGAIIITGYTGSGTAVVISNFVISIANDAVEGKTNLTSVTIPGNIADIVFRRKPI